MAHRKRSPDVTMAVAIILSFPLFLGLINNAMASAMTYQRDYSYQASESDSKISCRTIALEQVKRLLLEELGSYLVSQTEVKDFQISRDQVIAYLNRGAAYRNIGRYEEALRDYQKSIEINQADPDAYHGRGYVYFLMKKYDDALRDINKALELNQNSVMALYRRGLVYNQLKDYKNAIHDFSKVIEFEKDHAAAYYHLSLSYKQTGKADEAAIDIKKSAQLGEVRAKKAIEK